MWREIGRQVQPRGIKSENSGICGDDEDEVAARSKLAAQDCSLLYSLQFERVG